MLEKDTYQKLSRLVIKYLGREPESETLYTKVTLIFGLDRKCVLILKMVEETSYINKGKYIGESKDKLIKLKGHVIRFIYKRNENLVSDDIGSQIHISTKESKTPDKLIEFPKVSMSAFENLTTQTLITSCIERDAVCTNEYKAQFDTLNRLIDVYSEYEAICWSIWLFLNEVFSYETAVIERLSKEVAEEMLTNGIPITLSMRLRLITTIPDEVLNKLHEYTLIDKIRPKYGNTFEQIFIPRGDYITIMNFLTCEVIRVAWKDLMYYLCRGNLYPLVLSNSLGELV